MRFASPRQFGLISMIAYLPLLVPGWTSALVHQEAAAAERCAVSCPDTASNPAGPSRVACRGDCAEQLPEKSSVPEDCPCPTCPEGGSDHCVCSSCAKCVSDPPVLGRAFLAYFYERPSGAAAPPETRPSRLFRPPRAT